MVAFGLRDHGDDMDPGFELKYVFSFVRRRFLILVAIFTVVFATGSAIALLLPAVFRSQATILVESQQIPDALVRSTVTSLADERIQIIEQRVMTRANMLRIIDKFDLYRNRREWLNNTELVELARESTSIDRIQFTRGNRRRFDAATVAFTVAFEIEDPAVAVQVTNELVTLILDENVRARTLRASETTKFLTRETEQREQELNKLEFEIARFKEEHNDALPENLKFRQSSLERMERRLIDIETEFRTLDQEQRLFELGMEFRGSSVQGIPDGALTKRERLTQRLNQIEAELVQRAATYASGHPVIRHLTQEMASIRVELATETGDDLSSEDVTSKKSADGGNKAESLTDLQLTTFEERRSLLKTQQERTRTAVEKLVDSINRTPQVQLGLNALNRRYAVIQLQYNELVQKQAAAELGESLELDKRAERFEVIEQPTLPQVPVRPNRPLIFAFGFLLAIGASGGSVFGLELLDPSIRSPGQIYKALNRRPIVTIPYIRTLRETVRFRNIVLISLLLLFVFVLAAMAIFHFFVMPIDLLILNMQTKLQSWLSFYKM